jgi:hypothetical protein
MKRMLLLSLAASLLTSCERPTGPATHDPPDFSSTAATSTTFSGDATVLRVRALGLEEIVVGRTSLSESGGAEKSSVLSVSREETNGLLSAEVVHAAVVGQGNSSHAEAFVASVSLTVANITIEAGLLRSRAKATCDGAGQASASGSSELAELVINGSAITVSGEPNQTENLPGLKVVINEQSGSAEGDRADITVNALHVTAFDPMSKQELADVVISSAHADISCAACTEPVGDFVTGGGWITGTPSKARANFAVAGGVKHGELWGHLTYIDHGPRFKVKGTSVMSYGVFGAIRRITGMAEVDGVGDIGYTVDVTDAGEPGRDDTFSIILTNGYKASGKLAGGNIQLHAKPGPCP